MPEDKPKQPGIFSLLKPYSGLVFLLILFALFSNSVSLWLPKIVSHGIDDYIHSVMHRAHFNVNPVVIKFGLAITFILFFHSCKALSRLIHRKRLPAICVPACQTRSPNKAMPLLSRQIHLSY